MSNTVLNNTNEYLTDFHIIRKILYNKSNIIDNVYFHKLELF